MALPLHKTHYNTNIHFYLQINYLIRPPHNNKSAPAPKDESAYFRGTTNVLDRSNVKLPCQLQDLNAARRLHLLHSAQKLLSDLQTCHGKTSTNRFLSMPQLQPYSSYSLPCYISNTALILSQNNTFDNGLCAKPHIVTCKIRNNTSPIPAPTMEPFMRIQSKSGSTLS